MAWGPKKTRKKVNRIFVGVQCWAHSVSVAKIIGCHCGSTGSVHVVAKAKQWRTRRPLCFSWCGVVVADLLVRPADLRHDVYRSCGSAVSSLWWGLNDNHQTITKKQKRTQSTGLLKPILLLCCPRPVSRDLLRFVTHLQI